jgi:hypothetical protein
MEKKMSLEESTAARLTFEQASAELHRHTRRVGIDWSVISARLMTVYADELAAEFGPEFAAAEGDPVFAGDPVALLPVLRALPDGAGDEALVQAIAGT